MSLLLEYEPSCVLIQRRRPPPVSILIVDDIIANTVSNVDETRLSDRWAHVK